MGEIECRVHDGENLSEVVTRAVAALTGKRPTDLQPLNDSIDTDALDSVFTRSGEVGAQSLTLLYGGCRVEIDGDTVTVDRIDTDPSMAVTVFDVYEAVRREQHQTRSQRDRNRLATLHAARADLEGAMNAALRSAERR